MRLSHSLLCLGLTLLLLSCDRSKISFDEWYKREVSSSSSSSSSSNQVVEFRSGMLPIQKIYRSMQGPYEIKPIVIDSTHDELIWINGYESKVVDLENKQDLGPAYMCHNNLDYGKVEKLPWKLKTSGANNRIFTLSQGQTKIEFPEGFGIPIPANQELSMVSQVLNHHEKEIDLQTQHYTELRYVKESESQQKMTALYQQAVFVTKQLAGPEGGHGMPLSCLPYHNHKEGEFEADVEHDCSIDYAKDAKYNPYEDDYGRKYTGHWVIPYGSDTLRTNVTQMLDLTEDSRIHMISVHLHPFAEALELWDLTSNEMIYEASFEKDSLDFGFKSIDYYSSQEGIPVLADHQYELISAYNCTDSLNEHTAMAVLYLYLRE